MAQTFKIVVFDDWFIEILMKLSRCLDNASIIIAECTVLINDVLLVKNNDFLDLQTQRILKIVID